MTDVATCPPLAEGMREWVEQAVGPITGHRLLSTSNSRVWLVSAGAGTWTAKHLVDRSSSPRAEQVVMARLGHRVAVRRPLDLAEQPDGSWFVLADYSPGDVLADRLAGATAPEALAWAEQARQVIDAVADVPVTGFGKVQVLEPSGELRGDAASWPSFLYSYLDSQRRKAPELAELRYERLVRAVRRSEPELELAEPRLLPADVNLRNSVVDGGTVTCINMPVLWSGDTVAAYGEAVLHWSGTAGADVFARAAGELAASSRLHLYAAVHAYVILAYVERFADVSLTTATPWGASTPLLTLLDEHLTMVEEG